MMNVQIDGTPFQGNIADIKTMGDLLELIKASIDPDTMITVIEFNGEALTDADWNAPLNQQNGRVLDVRTGTKRAYVGERLAASAAILEQIENEFADAGNSYRGGFSPDGNSKLSHAVDDLGAFVQWYNGLLTMDEVLENQRVEFMSKVDALQKICEQIVQQQLYNSWWVLAETINTRLNPKLQEMRGLCSEVAQTMQ